MDKNITPIVALSGGIASGKTTVSDFFAEKNVPVIDADVVAKKVVEKSSKGLKGIVNHFGNAICLPSGELDRVQLRNIVFNDENERLWLNHYLHPIIQAETDRQMAQLDGDYILWVVPLLIENNLHQKADRVLIIDMPKSVQIERLMMRDNVDEALAKKMLAAQIPNEERLQYADDIIINNGDKIALSKQIERLHFSYLFLFSAKCSCGNQI